MSRIRTAEAAGNSYQGQVGGDQYYTVQAPSSDKAVQGYKQQLDQDNRTKRGELERDQAQERSEKEYNDSLRQRALQKDQQVETDSLAAVQLVDKGNLDLQNRYQTAIDTLNTAEVQAQGQVAAANMQATGTIIKGITSLSSSYLGFRKEQIKVQEEEAVKQSTIGMLGGIKGAIVGQRAQAAETTQLQVETAEVSAINKSIPDAVTRQDALSGIQTGRTLNNTSQSNTLQFGMGLDGQLRDFMSSSIQIKFPSGRIGTPGSAQNNAEVTFALQVGLGEAFGGADLNSMSGAKLQVLGNQAQNSIRAIGGEWSKTITKRRQDGLTTSALNLYRTNYKAGQPASIADVDNLAASYFHAGGKTQLEAKNQAIKDIVATYNNANNGMGDKAALTQLARIKQRNGLTIGDEYGDIINKAINNSETDYDTFEKNQSNDIKDDMYASLSGVEDREERIAIAEQTVQRLRDNGLDEEAFKLEADIQNLSLPGQGKVEFNTILGGINDGSITDPKSIDEAVSLNRLTASQGQSLKDTLSNKNSARTPKDKDATDIAKAESRRITDSIAGLLGYGKKDLNGNYTPNEQATQHLDQSEMGRLKDSIQRDVNRITNQVLVNDPSLTAPENKTKKLKAIKEALQEYYKNEVESPSGKWYYGDAGEVVKPGTSRDGTTDVKEVSAKFTQRLRDNLDDSTKFSVPFQNPTSSTSSISPRNFTDSVDVDKGSVSDDVIRSYNALRNDRVITPDVTKEFAAKWNQGEVDPRLQSLANKLNRSPQSLLQSQLAANGLRNSTPLSWPEPVESSVPLTAVQGAEQFMSMGVPARGAAWLAGNIQHESGWKGQRPQWDLGWDGAGTNGGLLSWNRGRLAALEARYGRKSTEITTRQQMTFLLDEMKNSYPRAYKIFMNPLSSDRQMIKASKIYIGYNDTDISQEGRYATSRSLAQQLQR